MIKTNGNIVFPWNHPQAEKYRLNLRRLDKSAEKNVNVYILPKGKAGKLAGSFIYKYRPTTFRENQLRAEASGIKRKIKNLQSSKLNEESCKKLNRLRCSLKYVECKLQKEIASIPHTYSGYIVAEEEDE